MRPTLNLLIILFLVHLAPRFVSATYWQWTVIWKLRLRRLIVFIKVYSYCTWVNVFNFNANSLFFRCQIKKDQVLLAVTWMRKASISAASFSSSIPVSSKMDGAGQSSRWYIVAVGTTFEFFTLCKNLMMNKLMLMFQNYSGKKYIFTLTPVIS